MKVHVCACVVIIPSISCPGPATLQDTACILLFHPHAGSELRWLEPRRPPLPPWSGPWPSSQHLASLCLFDTEQASESALPHPVRAHFMLPAPREARQGQRQAMVLPSPCLSGARAQLVRLRCTSPREANSLSQESAY